MHKGITILLFIFITLLVKAQVITVTPTLPTINSNISVVFDATQGNAELKDYNGTVYAHTGVITAESTGPGDWKHVVSGWGTTDPKVAMTSLGNNKYKIEYNIKSFYGIQDGEQVLELAFVFRNADGSKVGRSVTNGDIFYPINSDTIATEYQSSIFRNDSLIITCSTGTIYIVPFTSDIVNISTKPRVSSSPAVNSYSTILSPKTLNSNYSESTDELSVTTDEVKVVVKKSNLSVSFIENGDTVATSTKPYSFLENGGSLAFKLKNNEVIYGTGSRAISLNLRGQKLNVYNNASYGYGFGAKDLNICLPIVTSSRGYGIFVDNHSRGIWDIGATIQDKMTYTFQGGATSYFFIGGNGYSNIAKNITLLTGKQPLPPRWALGYIQSKFGYQNESEARSIVSTLRSNKFPIDAIVLDLYWFGTPQTMGKMDWDLSRFPNPTKMMSDFDEVGVKTILISETYFTQQTSNFYIASQNGYLAKNSTGNSYIIGSFWAGSAGLLDITNPQASDWFWSFYKSRTDEGVSGWWTDLGEPENHPNDMIHFGGKRAKEIHNIYGLLWEKLISDKWKQNYPAKRLFNLTRSGYAGMQRYSTFPWSGDIQRSFEGLRAQVPIMLSLGLTGIGYMHSDVGGFTGGAQDNELFTRWIQFGTFAPILRVHGTGIPTEPTAYSATTQTIVRDFINLRYSLLPYNYTLAWLNTTTGEPLARPLDYYESQNQLLQNNNDEFFWGENLLIAPILQRSQTSRNVIFPSGKWVDWWSGKTYSGNSTSNVSAPLERIPLFAKSGSFIPMVKPKLSTEFLKSDSLYIKFFIDPEISSSEFTMFEDDGKNPSSIEAEEFKLIHLSSSTTASQSNIYIKSEGNGYSGMPSLRNLFFELPRINAAPSNVVINGTPSSQRFSPTEFESTSEGWFWNSTKQILNIHSPWSGDNTTITIENVSVGIPTIENHGNNITISEVYPNPANEIINFSVTLMQKEELNISILGIDGRLIQNYGKKILSLGSTDLTFNVQTINPGFYFVKVSGVHGTFVKKWVKR
ncbi:MAG: TIM-barrel domain-containing protein [Tenuifilaceae bacterium]